VMLVDVFAGLESVPGVVGGMLSTGPLASQDAPLSLQLVGVTPPGAPIQPKLVDWPTPRVAFQVPVATTWLPVLTTWASQNDEMVAPAGRSNSTCHVSGLAELLTMVNLPS
jgi:hypothetical protein